MRVVSIYRKQPNSQFLSSIILEKLFSILHGEDLRTGHVLGPPAKNNDVLFVNQRDTDYHLWEELSIVAYYNGLSRQAWLQIDKLDLTTKLHWHDFNRIFGQLHWYDWYLKPRRQTRFQPPTELLPWATEPEATVWQPFNPSIRVKGDGYLVNLRYANYYTAEAKHYHYRGFDGKVLTRNCLMYVPREAGWNNPRTLEEIKISDSIPQRDHYIRGVEDCRLIQGTNEMEFLGTSQSYSDNGTNKIFHAWRGKEWFIKQMPLPAGVDPGEAQKNWLGFKHRAELLYIYSFSPFKICDAEGKTRVEAPFGRFSLKEYRGSAGPVPWKSADSSEAYLCVMHKVYVGDEGRRYYHRFMTLDKDLRPSRVSCLLRMTKERIEYWSGMCLSIEGDSYWITYGTRDSEAYIAEILTSSIESLLMYNMKTGVGRPTAQCLATLKDL
jgi:hypothetical protein